MKRHKAAKARTVAHHHKHVKPAHAHHKAAATGHHHKHHKAHKHHHIAKKHKGQVHRGLALGDAAACCAAEALAASLRLSGHSVADEDVLALYFNTARHLDEGASILATLEAAWLYGLRGLKPRWAPVTEPLCTCGLVGAGQPGLGAHEAIGRAAEEARGVAAREDAPHASLTGPVGAQFGLTSAHGLILGVDLPGPHTVLATPDGWWSWGELWCPWCEFPDAVIEEAWSVSWR